MATHVILFGLLTLSVPIALATDPNPLQDFCVADPKSQGMKTTVSYDRSPSLPYGWKINNIYAANLICFGHIVHIH